MSGLSSTFKLKVTLRCFSPIYSEDVKDSRPLGAIVSMALVVSDVSDGLLEALERTLSISILASELTILFQRVKSSELQGKENGVNILKSIDEGPFQMGNFQEILVEGTEGALYLGAAGYGGAQNRVGNANLGQARQIKFYKCNGIAQENGVALDEEQLLFITMFMANLSSAYPGYDEAGPSYDSDILSEVHDNDHYQDAICEHHEVHKMHDDVQPNYIVDSHADYTSDSNMIPYDQYVKDNAMLVVQSNVSSVPNDAYMMILNDMHEQSA
ncbi:hypothetical protein Tco_0658261 [Tanacetum coccineum]